MFQFLRLNNMMGTYTYTQYAGTYEVITVAEGRLLVLRKGKPWGEEAAADKSIV